MKSIINKAIMLSLIIVAFACDKDNEGPQILELTGNYSWDCPGSCSDVFTLTLKPNSNLTFSISQITDGSIAHAALYAPGDNEKITNLLTGNASGASCFEVSCYSGAGGFTIENVQTNAAGNYTLEIIRDYGNSCGTSGDYKLTLVSTKHISMLQIQNDQAVVSLSEPVQVCE